MKASIYHRKGGVKMRLPVVLLAVMLMLSIGRATPLGTVDIALDGFGAGDIITVWGGGREGISCYAGVYMLIKNDGTGQGDIWPDGAIGSFCIDLPQYALDNIVTYQVVMPEYSPSPPDFLGGYMGEKKAQYLSELWGRFFDPDWLISDPFHPFSCQQNKAAGAFAAAIWEIIYEQLPASPLLWDVTVDGTEGKLGFRACGVDAKTANAWLHSLDGTGQKANLRVFRHDEFQDYIVMVPEPATVALLGLGSVILACRRIK